MTILGNKVTHIRYLEMGCDYRITLLGASLLPTFHQPTRSGFKTVGDCPNFAQSAEQNGTVPFSETVLKRPLRTRNGRVIRCRELKVLIDGPQIRKGRMQKDGN